MLKGKNIIVTGATRGIGREIALTLAKNGANLAINYRNLNSDLENLLNEIKSFGVDALAVKCDVSVLEEVNSFIEKVKSHYTTIDVLVNNAGITKDGLILRMKEEDFDDVLDVNLKGTFNTTKSVSSIMVKQKYGKIINIKHFERLCGLMDRSKIAFGGDIKCDTLQIAPTVMDNVTYEDAIMGEEIFGPIMPVIAFDEFDEIVKDIKNKTQPLALYLFTSNKKQINCVETELCYGGGCINDVIIHIATSEMGFGGVGESGMGSYHGKAGFEAFSHSKSIVNKKTWLDLPMRYQPYKSKFNEKLLKRFLK